MKWNSELFEIFKIYGKFFVCFFEIHAFKEIWEIFFIDFVNYLVKIFEEKVISESFWKNCS